MEWTVPNVGWHWDGIHFRHYVDAPDQGLVCLCLFSDIGPQGGGTLVVEGSHHLCHPFLIHAASPNHSGVPRFMCNRASPLKERLRFAAAGAADESPLERSGLNFAKCAQYHPYRLLN
ncbi:hypothetical protein PAT3040_00954 [Paenibacillus agaridevorans]|uniref:Phytanoyl-CoA dioxygenase n=1 Tax=Paenibacillus agaridevorans TaxID=171404 RepID=A0A2R5EIS5_9BACL|nr:hypothetical protein [Paenibacillus agaridevorans]GBG06427.1 hypothetical protein PAT3040_00954 [Paenibacillus agaridevorans]